METVQIKGVTYPITDQVLDELRNGKDSQIIQLTSRVIIYVFARRCFFPIYLTGSYPPLFRGLHLITL